MFKRKILKVLALVLVLNILIIPLTSFCPQEQNKYKVMAAEGVVDSQFYAAILTMIGITSVMIGSMSENFSIPEADFTALKDQFAQSLEVDATKKAVWMEAQTDYLAGGIAKTMGAVELAKIGINDIYDQFKEYLMTWDSAENYNDGNVINSQLGDKTIITAISDMTWTVKILSNNRIWTSINGSEYRSILSENSYLYNHLVNEILYYDQYNNFIAGIGFTLWNDQISANYYNISNDPKVYQSLISNASMYGIDLTEKHPELLNNIIDGNFTQSNVLNSTDTNITIIPTIPWIDNTVPVGTVVNPEIAAPYAGTVPIDVPITVPIDPPIDEPIDPPADETLLGTVAAILAGLTPIAGFLEYILAGQVSLTDTIEAGITGVIDGIGDIAGTLTGGITSTLTDIQTAINDMVNPSPENVEQLNLDPIKNIPAVLFSRFPFSIPFDFYNIIAYMGGSAREAPEFNFTVPLSSIGQEDVVKAIDMGPFDQIAGYIRIAELIAFAIAVMLKTKTLIWG